MNFDAASGLLFVSLAILLGSIFFVFMAITTIGLFKSVRSGSYHQISRNLASHSSACSPTSLTDHASASARDRATPASTKVSST